MPSFLEKTARHILNLYGSDLSEICIVMPNRRAGLFLRKFLAQGLTKPVWSPVVFSIEDFMALLSGLKQVDPVFLLIDLYEVHRKTDKEKAQTFDEFLSWGSQLLSDFNEIDRYMADPDYLFTYLDEVRAINIWNLDKTPLTEFQKNYLKFYQSLKGYYSGLTESLLARGEAYQGLVFRRAVECLESGKADLPWKKIVFTGFNALTTAEERAMQYLHEAGMAEFLWDADRYYLNQTIQEAGTFLRNWFSKWPLKEKNWIFEDFLNGEKSIEVIGVPDVAGQVKLAGEILQQSGAGLDERTAIVLPDEKLLLPLLNSLPPEVDELNVTMGLPLKQTPLADLLDLVFQAHLHAPGMKAGKIKASRFYYRDVLKILQHPFVNRIAAIAMEENHFALGELINRIRSGNLVFLRKEDLAGNGLFDVRMEFLEPFFGDWKDVPDVIADLRKMVDLIKSSVMREPGNQVEAEYAFAFTGIIYQLNEIVTKFPDYFSIPILYRFFRQMMDNFSLPFYGEPLKGVQVMGMLETRTLDFDQLIILSCNEGLLPAAKMAHSFIPFDIKREFGLPAYQQKDAVYAYHFYRLLQRAQKVWLLYSTEPDQLGGGEKSRFIQQISRELPAYNPKIKFRERFLNSPLPRGISVPPISISKTGETLDKLIKKASRGFAPTAINAFRKCPLRFYFSEIAILKEPEELMDDIDPKTLGNAVHQALFQLYEPLKNQILTVPVILSMIDSADGSVEKAFQDHFKGSTVQYGKNLLLVNVARMMVRNFLKSEIRLVEDLTLRKLPLTILMLEQPLHRSVTIQSGGQETEVHIKGFVDRIDRIGNETRILDYKTGSADKKELFVKSWDDLLHDPVLDKGFQLISYAWLLMKPGREYPFRAGIVSLKKPGMGVIAVRVPGNGEGNPMDRMGEQELQNFEKVLKSIVSEVFDLSSPFTQTAVRESCVFCPYTAICGR